MNIELTLIGAAALVFELLMLYASYLSYLRIEGTERAVQRIEAKVDLVFRKLPPYKARVVP